MHPPAITPREFEASKVKFFATGITPWVSLAGAVAVLPVVKSLATAFGAQDSMIFYIVAALAYLAVVYGISWRWQTALWRRLQRLGPILTFDAEGLYDRARWRMPVPWERITRVQPICRSDEDYSGLIIEIAGRNDISKSAFHRWADNWIARPLGSNPYFTLSFKTLDAGEAEVADLVQQITATARA